MTDFYVDTITLRGKEILVKIGFLPVLDLKFYPENPRIYSIISEVGKEPSQEEIFEKLSKMEHVLELVQSIKANKGLREPLIVRDGMVLEGNSRLAAYRILMEKDAIAWGKVKCKALPENVGDDVAFAILADHISGKKDWKPYEQAGYLYRRNKNHNVPIGQIASDMGLSVRNVNFLIEVYSFMLEKGDTNIDRWSYYYEYLRCSKVKKAREKYPDLDDVVVEKIKSNEIPKAVDLRDKLKVILSAKPSTVAKFVSGERTFEKSYDSARDQGHDNTCYKRLNTFRTWIVVDAFDEMLFELDKEIQAKCKFELSRIHKKVEKILVRLDENK